MPTAWSSSTCGTPAVLIDVDTPEALAECARGVASTLIRLRIAAMAIVPSRTCAGLIPGHLSPASDCVRQRDARQIAAIPAAARIRVNELRRSTRAIDAGTS